MVSYNIGHLAFLNAKRYGIQRVFFGGFFIRGHRYTMNVISYAIWFWSKGEMSALFLRHEGFLGVMGAFLKGRLLALPSDSAALSGPFGTSEASTGEVDAGMQGQSSDDTARSSKPGAVATATGNSDRQQQQRTHDRWGSQRAGAQTQAQMRSSGRGMSAQLSAQFVERYPMGSPFSGGTILGRPFANVSEKVSWVEKFMQVRIASGTLASCLQAGLTVGQKVWACCKTAAHVWSVSC